MEERECGGFDHDMVAVEVTPQLRAHTALPEDLSLIPNTLIRWLTTPVSVARIAGDLGNCSV